MIIFATKSAQNSVDYLEIEMLEICNNLWYNSLRIKHTSYYDDLVPLMGVTSIKSMAEEKPRRKKYVSSINEAIIRSRCSLWTSNKKMES